MRVEEPLANLLNGEFIGLAAVVGCMSSVLYVAASVAVRTFISFIRKQPRKLNRIEIGFLVAALIGIICIAYGYFVEPYELQVTNVHLRNAKLNGASRPIRIVQISDLHCASTVHTEDKIPSVIAAQKPDAIVFTGDAINSPDALPVFKTCMKKLSAIAPTYAVYGNHDSREWKHVGLYTDTGVKVLDGNTAIQQIAGKEICFGGLAVDSERRWRKMLAAMPPADYGVVLYHFPSGIEFAQPNHTDLFLCGHTHGGQVRLPFYGAVITRSKMGKKYEAGLYQVGGTTMYVNRGIGMEGGFSPPVRFLCLPEITVFDLASQR